MRKFAFVICMTLSTFVLADTTEYSFDDFQKDVVLLIPLASKLKAHCIAEGDHASCDQADSIIRSLRQLSLLIPNSESGESDKTQFMQIFINALLDGYVGKPRHADGKE